MSFQVTLTNELSGNVNLKMCDPGNLTNCSNPVGKNGKGIFPKNPGSINQVIISPTDPNLAMPSNWLIKIEKTGVTHDFVSKDYSVTDNGTNDDGIEIILYHIGGTTNWELLINEHGSFRQPTNVTIGDN
jgi:hypothetical protein